MSPITRAVVTALKGIAAVAAVVAFFCPLSTWNQILIFVGSVFLFLLCHALLSNLDDTYLDEHMKGGYWPSKPTDWGHRSDENDAPKK